MKKILLISGIIVVAGITSGVAYMSMDEDAKMTDPKQFSSLGSGNDALTGNDENTDVPASIEPSTVSTQENQPAGATDEAQGIAPTATMQHSFNSGNGTITVTVDPSTVQLELITAVADGTNLGSRPVKASTPVAFSYATETGQPLGSVTITITDKSGKSYTSTHALN